MSLRQLKSYWRHHEYSPRFWYWRLKARFWDRPNTIVVKYFSPWYYTDRCDLVRHAVLQCLVDWAEQEKPWGFWHLEELRAEREKSKIDGEDLLPYHVEEYTELREIYDWYKSFAEFDSYDYVVEKLRRLPSLGAQQSDEEKTLWIEAMDKEQEFENEFTKRAMRVVELWGMLWT